MSRPSHPKRAEAVFQAVEALVDGRPKETIARTIAANYQVYNKTARNWISRAVRLLASEQADAPKFLSFALGRSIRRRDALYFKAWQNGDLRLCLSVEQDLCKLLGLYAPEKLDVKHEGKAKDLPDLTDEERVAIIRAGKKKDESTQDEELDEPATPAAQETEPGEAAPDAPGEAPKSEESPSLTESALEGEPAPPVEPAIQPLAEPVPQSVVESVASPSEGVAPRADPVE